MFAHAYQAQGRPSQTGRQPVGLGKSVRSLRIICGCSRCRPGLASVSILGVVAVVAQC